MRNALIMARTVLALGVPSLARALHYKLSVKTGVNPVRRIRAQMPLGPFFREGAVKGAPEGVTPPADDAADELLYFGWYRTGQRGVPDWHRNPFNREKVALPWRPWWAIVDFDAELGDIKTVWEASRLDWALVLARQAACGRMQAIKQLNVWLTSWSRSNPPYMGPNWKCGQEASIRVMHLAMTALILGQHRAPEPALLDLIRAHLRRIAPTIGYAIAQDNNHGTSEAAALFIGGSWLAALGDPAGHRWQRLGAFWLENRARRLIASDGSFSQHSVTYHRLMLDTYAMAEVWRRQWGLAAFSKRLHARLGAATDWLYQMTDPISGDAPNFGANDGARLLPLTDTDYRDFRPSVQLGSALFLNATALAGDGPWNEPLRWLGIPRPAQRLAARQSAFLAAGGYGLLHKGRAFAMFNLPRYRHRPSQADALHIDLWVGSENVLRDAGSFSYARDDLAPYFGGTASHNTVQFDKRDQMPRLSRFLFGAWLRARDVMPVKTTATGATCAAGYRDWRGCTHHRELVLEADCLRVVDQVAGFQGGAVLRWRLRPGAWLMRDVVLTGGGCLRVSANVPIRRIELTNGLESRYYLKTEPVAVLEVELDRPGTLTTEFYFLA